ncbi:unnamed protein product [Rhizophagus irregularis]|nr:unnamed protein product [Rhizophagus irregularis]
MAENTLYDIFNFLCKNDITLKNIITYGTQFNLNNVILSTNFSHIYEEWDYVQRDNEAMKLIPEKYANHICIKSTPNGNCFLNSASLIAFGHEDNHMQLRLAVMIELMVNADHYLQQEIFEQDIFYRDKALDNINMETQNNSFKKASEYISELKLMCKPNSWCSMIAFFGLASVLHRPIESLFPQTGNTFMNQIYNRIIMPRQGDHFYPHCIIMWSSISAEDFQSSVTRPGEVNRKFEFVWPNDLTADKTNNEHITDSEVDPNTIIGLFMGIDSDFIPNIDKIGDYLIYSDAKDFQFEISYQKALSSLFICDIDKNQNFNYHWRDWQISNYHLFELLRKQPEFPPQISISVNKTYENNKTLVKQCYCGGCDKSNQTTFKIVVNKMDLIQLREVVKINVVYLTNKRKCKHLDGKMFGQCRGYARQVLAKSKDFGSPRDMRKKILLNVKNEVRYTGNRQGIPSAHSARTIYSSKNKENKSGYNLCERLHAAILDINSNEKDDYKPIQTQPLSVVIFNEAGICYYHYNVSNNPGIFLDYTGQLVKPVPHYLTPVNNSNNKRILNAFYTMPSSNNSSDAPPVDVFELVTNDLSSKNLQHYLHIYRQKELKLFGSNSVPFLINTDCARNLLIAILGEYNNENVDQYIDRMTNSVINNEFDRSKVIVGWCFGHAIRAIRHHIRSKNFIVKSGYDRGILSKFAMRVWNSVRVTETLPNAEREIEKWEWIMSQEYFELANENINLIEKKKFLNKNFDITNIPDLCLDLDHLDPNNLEENMNNNPMQISHLLNPEESHSWTYNLDNNVLLKIIQENNENYKILIPQLDITVSAQLSQSKSIKNPFYSLNLVKYMDKVWWKTIILWSNLVPAVKSRTRRTTATVEVENNIVKNLDIGKKNLPIDQYIYTRTQTLKSTQNLIAETLMRKKR